MDILGIGNAILDLFWFSDDESALSLGLHPNRAAHFSPERLDELLLAVPPPIYISGGAASNTVKAAAALGAKCAFFGCAGTDEGETDRWARIFSADLSAFGVKSVLEPRKGSTGRCLVIHMPGGLKSIACAPGVSTSIEPEQIPEQLIIQSRIVFLDGQILRNEKVIESITRLCREHGIPLALDVCATDIARDFSPKILDILTRNRAILLMNDDEALALAIELEHTVPGDRGVQSSDDYIGSIFSFLTARNRDFPCIVHKMGSRGARAWQKGKSVTVGTIPITNPLDDTAAGDTFNGAFLAAWLRLCTLEASIKFANEAASEALTVPGSRLDIDQFTCLRDELRDLTSEYEAKA